MERVGVGSLAGPRLFQYSGTREPVQQYLLTLQFADIDGHRGGDC